MNSTKRYFDGKKKNYFEEEKSSFIKDLFSDEELKYSWDEGENTVKGDSINMDDCHTPKNIEESNICDNNCNNNCDCKSLNVDQNTIDIQNWKKRFKKDSTEQLNSKLNSDKFNSDQKTIITDILNLRKTKR